jgi:hypothetical protein
MSEDNYYYKYLKYKKKYIDLINTKQYLTNKTINSNYLGGANNINIIKKNNPIIHSPFNPRFIYCFK